MDSIIQRLEEERNKMNEEAKKYPTEDKRNMYYMGCSIGLSKSITFLELSSRNEKIE